MLNIIDALYSNEDVKNPKPAGDIYELAAQSFNVHPENVAVFEDSVKGFEAVVRAGGNE